MWDIAALVALFLVLVGTLAVIQYLPGLLWSKDPDQAQALLDDWFQAHKVKLPTVAGVIAVINKQLEKELDSKVGILLFCILIKYLCSWLACSCACILL